MTQVVLVPGVFGCSMTRRADGFTLWPPVSQSTPISTQERADALLLPDTAHGPVIEWLHDPLLHQPEYGPVLRLLGRMHGVTVTSFAYDWRLDLTAAGPDALAACLDGLARGERIILVAHSMGGLLARWLLESGRYEARPWFGAIEQLVCVCVPHLGAPLALFRIMGLEDFVPIVFDRVACRILSSRPDLYPAGHQLLPGSQQQAVSFDDGTHATVATAFPQLGTAGLTALDRLHAVLDRFARPAHVIYRLAYGRGLPTVSRILARAPDDLAPREAMDSGDTTVPIWSACPSLALYAARGCFADEAVFDQADHVGMLQDPRFQAQLQLWIAGTSLPMA